jgi:hypothetical protein
MRYLMLHRIDETATFDPAEDPGVPGSAAALTGLSVGRSPRPAAG